MLLKVKIILKQRKNYFYDEVFETFIIATRKTATSCLWILKRNGKVIFDGDNTYNIDFSVIGNKSGEKGNSK